MLWQDRFDGERRCACGYEAWFATRDLGPLSIQECTSWIDQGKH
jgi:hypothetical protein